MTTTKVQREMVREALKKGESLTQLDAFNRFGCFRLGARIWELRHEYGLDIASVMVKVGDKHVASYSLVKRRKAKAA